MSYYQFLKMRLHDIMWGSDLIASRFFVSLASIFWSFLLFWPGDTFARPTYTLMSKFANETTWAILFGLQGLAGLYSIIHKSRDKLLLVTDAVLGCMLWTGSCVAMLLSVYPPPAAISAEIVAAIMSWWILVRYPIDWEKKNE